MEKRFKVGDFVRVNRPDSADNGKPLRITAVNSDDSSRWDYSTRYLLESTSTTRIGYDDAELKLLPMRNIVASAVLSGIVAYDKKKREDAGSSEATLALSIADSITDLM